MNIQLIQGSLPVSDAPGLSTIDPRFTDIATLVQEGKYEEASAQSEEILAEEIYDIRIMGYFIYGHFLEQGLGAMEEIFQALADTLGDNLEAVGPLKNREKHIQTILNWLMKQLIKKLQYEEEKKADLWDRWLSDVSSEQAQAALDAAQGLGRELSSVLDEDAAPVLDGLTKVNEWLTNFQRLVYTEPDVEPEPDPEPDVEEEESVDEIVQEERAPRVAADAGDSVSIEGSYPLQLLVKKIQAFDCLIREEKISRAALVADDINHIIENFDPRVYFPSLFSRFTLQYATHINGLSAFDEYKASVEWQALQELYKVDLDSFVHFDSGGIQLSTSPVPGASDMHGMNGQEEGYDAMPDEDEAYPEEPLDEGGDDDEW